MVLRTKRQVIRAGGLSAQVALLSTFLSALLIGHGGDASGHIPWWGSRDQGSTLYILNSAGAWAVVILRWEIQGCMQHDSSIHRGEADKLWRKQMRPQADQIWLRAEVGAQSSQHSVCKKGSR
jgi:hypothetical protein